MPGSNKDVIMFKMPDCQHNSVTIYSRLVFRATRYEPAEYDNWAECDECGKQMDLSDAVDTEVSDEIEVYRERPGSPHEYYD
jgi:hypothetical protein